MAPAPERSEAVQVQEEEEAAVAAVAAAAEMEKVLAPGRVQGLSPSGARLVQCARYCRRHLRRSR